MATGQAASGTLGSSIPHRGTLLAASCASPCDSSLVLADAPRPAPESRVAANIAFGRGKSSPRSDGIAGAHGNRFTQAVGCPPKWGNSSGGRNPWARHLPSEIDRSCCAFCIHDWGGRHECDDKGPRMAEETSAPEQPARGSCSGGPCRIPRLGSGMSCARILQEVQDPPAQPAAPDAAEA